MKLSILLFLLSSTAIYAQEIESPKECQTEESRKNHYIAIGMEQAGRESDPWAGCYNGCTMQSSVADSMEATMKRFQAESRAAEMRSRAAEAARCPQWADRIMAAVGVPTAEQQERISEAYKKKMQEEQAKFESMIFWQKNHPQCKHVELWKNGDNATVDNFSGHFEGKEGQCSASSKGPVWLGTDDTIDKYDPAHNYLIGKVDCADILKNEGLYAKDAWDTDPKFCSDGFEVR